jgi:hypothetical protein
MAEWHDGAGFNLDEAARIQEGRGHTFTGANRSYRYPYVVASRVNQDLIQLDTPFSPE